MATRLDAPIALPVVLVVLAVPLPSIPALTLGLLALVAPGDGLFHVDH